ncbi:hypothetical protein BRO54_3168 [Geobacillus proteiniphilus]|uniref:Uncharacterized protein n=1 Tax=Geobacillus proteiniphilus TaxID=860353 RepID=A0A1Q5SPQ0_9BACL|nr:hypothetical protein [Geobacillus proteiniphilus]OKO89979.1 hypothetical protein BRO54_3168 [Geobacillus proteiniphilus]
MQDAMIAYALNGEGLYEQADVKAGTGVVQSVCFPGLQVALEDVFR